MKKLISKYIVATLFVAMGSATVSCSNDYLNTSPTESIDSKAAVDNVVNAYATLNGIAKAMTVQQAYYGQGFAGENAIIRLYECLPSQNYNYNRYASGWAPLHNQTFHTRTNSIYLSYAWAYYYQLIINANDIILNIDNAEGNEADKKFIKASALCFRAYAFEKLIHYYCYRWQDSNNGTSKGLPLRLDTKTDSIPAASLADTYKQVYADCEEAIKLFKESKINRNPSEVWIPNINVAHAIFARAALNKQDYQKALEQAKLALQGVTLMSGKEYAEGFYKPNKEWLLGSYGSEKEQNWYWAFGVEMACNGYSANNAETGAGTIGHELITRIPNNDARKQLFITEDKFKHIDIHKDVDQSFGLIKDENKDVYAQADSIIAKHSLPGLEKPYKNGFIYLDGQLKFWVTAQPGVSYVPFIRGSEMKLIEAEANYFLGNIPDAQRALVELNAGTGRNLEYKCTKTGKDLFNEIKDYREVELWGEGFAWSDYKRWNIPVVRKSFKDGGNAHSAVAKTIKPEDGNKWTWLIPQNEIDYNEKLDNK